MRVPGYVAVLLVLGYAVVGLGWLLGADMIGAMFSADAGGSAVITGAAAIAGAPSSGVTGAVGFHLVASSFFIAVTAIALLAETWRRARVPMRVDRRLGPMLDEVPSGLAVIDPHGAVRFANAAFLRLLGITRLEMIEHAFETLFAAQLGPSATGALLPATGEMSRRVRVRRGEHGWGDILLRVVRQTDDARHVGWVATLIDVTESRRSTEIQALYRRALDVARDGIIIADLSAPDQPITFASRALQEITGYSERELLGRNCRILQGSDRGQPGIDIIRHAVADGKPATATLRNYRKSGEMFWNEMRIAPMLQAGAPISHYIGITRDVTEARKVAQEREQLELRDPLTTLHNRMGFRSELKTMLATCSTTTVVLAKLNVIGFHDINTTFGYETGDGLLAQIGERIASLPRVLAGRLDADTFVIAAPIYPTQDGPPIMEMLSAMLERSFVLPGASLRVFFSIGYTYGAPDVGRGILMRQAAAALSEVRRQRSRVAHLYDARMEREISRRTRLSGDLHQAVMNSDFILHYQPKVTLDSGRIVGAEALIRWQHPTFGLQLPDRFITTAEHTGLIVPIGEWALREAAKFALVLNARAARPYHVSVNISTMQFEQANIVSSVRRVLEETGADPAWIILELRERLFAGDIVAIAREFRELRALGVGLSIDDFGTGFSSLRSLGVFPLTEIKFDHAFTNAMADDRAKRAVVEAVTRIGRELDVAVVAEDIETAAESRMLFELGCRYGQGYHFSKPLTGDDFADLVQGDPMLPVAEVRKHVLS